VSKILIVDDEDDIRLFLRKFLEGAGYDVEEASSGAEGFSKIKGEKFDLVCLDFFMSGRELLEKIRKEPDVKDTKVVFLTVANFSTSGIDELKKLGCLDYIQKPIENEDFIARVKKALDK
jgi:CheY-like chemotaxis protein